MNKEKIQKILTICDGKGKAAKTEALNELFEKIEDLEKRRKKKELG